MEAADVAVGVHCGGAINSTLLDVLHESWLHSFPLTAYYGDSPLPASPRHGLRLKRWPSRFLCTEPSEWGPTLWPDVNPNRNNSRWDRCVQMRFLYVLLDVRRTYPAAAAYLLSEADVLVDTAALLRLARRTAAAGRPWMLRSSWGTPHVLSRDSSLLGGDGAALMRCASRLAFHPRCAAQAAALRPSPWTRPSSRDATPT